MLFKEVCEKTAKELNLPVYIVEKVMRYQFKFLRQTMETGELKGIMFPNLGKFLCKPSRIRLLKERHDKQTIRIQNDKAISEGTSEEESNTGATI